MSDKDSQGNPKRCTCGCTIGLHYHTCHLASCAKCGPDKCQKFTEAKQGEPSLKASLLELTTNRGIERARHSLRRIVVSGASSK